MERIRKGYDVKRYGEFLDAMKDEFFEWQIWELETDLTHIRIDETIIPIRMVTFLDWLEWRLKESQNTEGVVIDVAFSEYETIN